MEENRERAGWQEVHCLADRLYLRIPEEYGRPSDEWMAARFPGIPRPQEVYRSRDGDRIITFNLLDKPLQEKQVYPAVREIERILGHIYPESVRIRARELRTEAGRIGWFSFITGGIRTDSVHCMFVLPVKDNMMLGSYHFPEGTMEADRKVFIEMLKSIRIQSDPLPSGKQGAIHGTEI